MSGRLSDFDWTRFWIPRDSHLLLDDDGFLVDPEGNLGRFLYPEALSVEAALSRRCAVLLGEPGIGKSTELERINRQGNYASAAAQILDLNLKDYSSDSLLVQELFDSPKFRKWKTGSHELLLSLDSLDECMLRVETVANLLSSRLGRYPVDRLWLRIACRTAVWAQLQFLEEALAKLWRQEHFGVFELLPLRRKDVETAAIATSIQPEAFLHELAARQAVPFAIKPLTLRFLLDKFRRDGGLPDKIEAVYFEGCRSLCTEVNPSRVATSQTGKLAPDQRLAVAGRLAALMIFTGRTAVRQGPSADQIEGDLSIQEALGGTEEENRQIVEITPEAIRETLDTGLFTARGPSRLGWAHQTYAEFLAARYLIRHGFDSTQIISLITHPDYSSRLVIPQLVQPTVCLVNMKPALFDALVQDSPHVLLRSEASAWDARQKSALTAAFLKLIAELKLTDSSSELWRSISKLDHPDLPTQLDPYIRDCTANPVVRRVAIGIAEASQVVQLREALLTVAVDRSDHQPTRVQAIRALRKVGDGDSRQRLLTLLNSDLREDDDDQIRGAVLSQVWPDLISFDELTSHLTPPKASSFIGAYWSFLKYELAKSLKLTDLPKALAWVSTQEGRYDILSPISEAAESILREGVRRLEDPAVLDRLADVITARLTHHRALWGENPFDESEVDPLQDDRIRHLLIRGLVEHASDAQSLSRLRIVQRLRESDLSWLLHQLSIAETNMEQKKWSILVQELFFTDVDRYRNPVLEAALQNEVLAHDLRFCIGPIDLDSPAADSQREQWQNSQALHVVGENEEEPVVLTIAQQVDIILEEHEDEERDIWWGLDGVLGDLRRREFNVDVRKYESWQRLDEKRRLKVIMAAQRHILVGEDTSNGSMSSSFSGMELASFRALYLASAEAPSFLNLLSKDVVQKWTPIVLRKLGIVDDKAEPYVDILRLVSQKAPDLVLDKLSEAIDQQNQAAEASEHPDLRMQIEVCWSDPMESLLVEKLKCGELKPGFSVYLMELLLAKGSEKAQRWALHWLEEPIPSAPEEQEKQLSVALSLLFIERSEWPLVWSRITELAALQGELAERTGHYLYDEFENGQLKTLSGPSLGEICHWLKSFPESVRPKPLGRPRLMAHGVIEVFRGYLFAYLQKAETPEALQALQHLASLRPDDSSVKWMLAEAQQASLQRTWIPPEPAELLAMAQHRESRLVDSGGQLLDVIEESLERLQQKLHGHDPLVEFLWDKGADDESGIHWQPKDERSLSIFVKTHLEDDLKGRAIILNREVEIRRSLGEEIRQGQETDIQIDAITHNPRSGEAHRVSVIIEVKGCWNKKLKSAMKEQLADRYLVESACRHAIYLVGWFLCDAWNDGDYRKKDTPKWTLQEANARLREQAAELSQEGSLIRAFNLDTTLR